MKIGQTRVLPTDRCMYLYANINTLMNSHNTVHTCMYLHVFVHTHEHISHPYMYIHISIYKRFNIWDDRIIFKY